MTSFRNIAVVFVAWLLFGFLGSLLAYASQFAFPFVAHDDTPGSITLLELRSVLPLLVVAVATSWIAAWSVRPRAARVWAIVFSVLVLLSQALSSPVIQNPFAFPLEFIFGAILASALLVAAVFLGFHLVWRRTRESAA